MDSLIEDYDWQAMTNNYNEQKILEVVNSLGDNATKRLFTFINIVDNVQKREEINQEFREKWILYYRRQQLEEILEGRNVALDYDEILNGIDMESYTDFIFGYAERLQRELCIMHRQQKQPEGVFHVENINNYGYISDILNQNKKKNDHQELE